MTTLMTAAKETRASLAVATKSLSFLWLTHLRNKRNLCYQMSCRPGDERLPLRHLLDTMKNPIKIESNVM